MEEGGLMGCRFTSYCNVMLSHCAKVEDEEL